MNKFNSETQTKLYGLDIYINELINLYNKESLPNKILLSGEKGIGKSTLAYHFINYVLSNEEETIYDIGKFEINSNSTTFKTILNQSNPNFILINNSLEKKNIDINQIRELILKLNKSSFNNKPRFILIDNIELLSLNSINALLKVLEEPSDNTYFILINSNKKIPNTLLSRCIDFKIFLSNKQKIEISNKLLENNFFHKINQDLLNYYFTPGNIYNLSKFAEDNKYDLSKLKLKDLLQKIIKDKHYKTDNLMKYFVFELMETYLSNLGKSFTAKMYNNYSYFINKISEAKKYNLDLESLFFEFENEVING